MKHHIISRGSGSALSQGEIRGLQSGDKTNQGWRTGDTVLSVVMQTEDASYGERAKG
jgi:hypothetical protein